MSTTPASILFVYVFLGNPQTCENQLSRTKGGTLLHVNYLNSHGLSPSAWHLQNVSAVILYGRVTGALFCRFLLRTFLWDASLSLLLLLDALNEEKRLQAIFTA